MAWFSLDWQMYREGAYSPNRAESQPDDRVLPRLNARVFEPISMDRKGAESRWIEVVWAGASWD